MRKTKKNKDFVYKAYYKGGSDALRNFIRSNLKYPEEALMNKIEGTVNLKFEIDYKGITRKVKIISGIGYGCDEEAIRLVKLLKYEVPKTRKLKVTYNKTLNIHFNLKMVQNQKKIKANNYAYFVSPKKSVTINKTQKGYNYTITM